MWMSPIDGDANSGGAGGQRPWWDFPTPLGVPKQVTGPHVCYQQRVTKTNDAYGQPVNCGPLFDSGGHVFDGWDAIEAWLQWSMGSENNP
jgi:hypothetical protein